MRNNEQPAIRFSEFKDDWNKVKLGKVFEQTSEYVNPKLKNIELWSLTVEKGLTPKTERYNREFLVKKEGQFKAVSNKEFIYNPMNMTLGAVDLNLTGKQVAVSGYYITMRINKEYDDNYFNVWLKSPLAIRMYKSFATGSLTEKQRVQFPSLIKIKASVPMKEEQIKIGNFFNTLDNKIILQQQELDTLKQTKKGFLQKMFPKEGETVPELRFSGFFNEWEVCKISDVANMFNNLRVPITASERIKGSTPYYGANGIQDYVEGYTHDGEFVLIAEDGASDLINYPVNYVSGKVWVNNHAHVLSGKKGDIDNFFLATRINNMNIVPYLVGGGRTKLNGETLKKILVKIPIFEEQIKIGKFFKQLDELIALQQQELDALKQTKKAFLQKMFV